MSERELNPNHPTLNAIREHWGKVAAFLVFKAGGSAVISVADMEAFVAAGKCNITIQELPDGIHLNLVDDETGAKLARMEGGLPH